MRKFTHLIRERIPEGVASSFVEGRDLLNRCPARDFVRDKPTSDELYYAEVLSTRHRKPNHAQIIIAWIADHRDLCHSPDACDHHWSISDRRQRKGQGRFRRRRPRGF